MDFSENSKKARRLLQDLSEQGLGPTSQADSPGATRSTPQDLLLGKLALDRGVVTPEQLEECLRERDSLFARGMKPLLGKILIERGYLKTEDLFELLQEQSSRSRGIPNLPRYEILEKVGEGGTAIVYRALDRELKRSVALKVLREGPGLNEISRERFRREAQTAAGLAHPNVIQVYDAGEMEGQLYMVMELVEGRPLSEIMTEGRATRKELIGILEQAARGVAAAHGKGIVHRDLKPANILLSPSGEPKVGDFGLAHLSEGATVLTRTGAALGTPLYMSPEQVEGRSRDITAQTDVYALGAILYEILTRRPPHTGETVAEIYGKIVKEEPVAPRKRDDTVSPDLETIALKALEKEAGKRYSSAQAFAEDLRRALDGDPIEARPVSGAEKLWRKAVKYRTLLGSAAAIALVGSILGGIVSRGGLPLTRIVFLERLEGDVRITRGGKEGPASVGQVLSQGDALESGPWPSRGVLRFENGTEIEIEPDSRVEDLSFLSGKRLVVSKGTIKADLMKQSPDERMTFMTPDGEISGTRSTFRIFIGSDPGQGTRIEVAQGQAEVRKPGGERVVIEAGSFATAAKGVELGAQPLALALDIGDGVKIELLHVSSGTFIMGSKEERKTLVSESEVPAHRVTLSGGYFLGKYEVTRRQFAVFVRATGYQTDAEKAGRAGGCLPNQWEWTHIPGLHWHNVNFPQTEDDPVVCISWNDATAFCEWATKRTGRRVRLPTEAEWEYACRAGTRTKWSFGDDESVMWEYAWYDKNTLRLERSSIPLARTHPVGQKKPNPWGFYDMSGNAWEWCQDWAAPFPAGDAVDPTGPTSGTMRILRGGDWHSDANFARSGNRGHKPPSHSDTSDGFRVAVP
jgi:formylglycine-generating enzyme required for sulfatase activity/tRNA A-37 threonylcarbamoyl transferase component Bud32